MLVQSASKFTKTHQDYLYKWACANTEGMFFFLSIGHVHQLHYVTNEVILKHPWPNNYC